MRTGRPTGQRWIREEIEESWTMGPDELAMLAGKRGPTRLGFAVALRFFAREGRFPEPAEEIHADAVAHVARQVVVPAEEYEAYDPRGRAAEYHRARIREVFEYRPATVQDAEVLADWLSEESAARALVPNAGFLLPHGTGGTYYALPP